MNEGKERRGRTFSTSPIRNGNVEAAENELSASDIFSRLLVTDLAGARFAPSNRLPQLELSTIQMDKINKISFSSDHLIEQIIEGRKTASAEWMQKQGELDEWDSALAVGSVYTVCDSRRKARCTIRVTSIRLCRWASIPEWLWRGETNDSAEEFRADHLKYFDHPGPDFEFVGFEFELVSIYKTDAEPSAIS